MDAPPPQEDCRSFVAVAQLLLDAGVHAPAVLAADLDRGFLLLTDLGHADVSAMRSMRKARRRCTATRRQRSCAGNSPAATECCRRTTETLLERELELFPDWYVAKHLGVALTAAQKSDARPGVREDSRTTTSRRPRCSCIAITIRAT